MTRLQHLMGLSISILHPSPLCYTGINKTGCKVTDLSSMQKLSVKFAIFEQGAAQQQSKQVDFDII